MIQFIEMLSNVERDRYCFGTLLRVSLVMSSILDKQGTDFDMAVPHRQLQHSSESEADSGAAAKRILRLTAEDTMKGAATAEQAGSDTGRSNAVEGGEPIEPVAVPSAIETKLASVLDMRVEGRSQAQIAAHFGVTERTVRRWEQEAKRRGITPLRDRDPFEFTRESLKISQNAAPTPWLATARPATPTTKTV